MEQYAGIDVSLELSSVCIVDTTGQIIREATVASEPEALITWFGDLGLALTRSGWRRVRCHNACMPRCATSACRSNCWKPDM